MTPELRVFQTRDHLSVISGVTPEGRLSAAVQDHSLKAVDSVAFLKHLLRYVSRKLGVVWDRAPIHRGHVVEDFLAKEAPRSAIHLEPLPPYAPELNPDEGVWYHLKNVELRNLCCPNPRRLRFELDCGLAWLRQRPYLIQSFFAEAGLQL